MRRGRKGVAMRSCVGCNARDAQLRLRRFVWSDGRLTWDARKRLPGRGAYLHVESHCLEKFLTRKPYLRSLRASVSVPERARLVAERHLR